MSEQSDIIIRNINSRGCHYRKKSYLFGYNGKKKNQLLCVHALFITRLSLTQPNKDFFFRNVKIVYRIRFRNRNTTNAINVSFNFPLCTKFTDPLFLDIVCSSNLCHIFLLY